MSGFDPVISLNAHIALLTLVEDAKKELEAVRGIILMATKALGRSLMAELEKSREVMKVNKMWVQDSPIGDRRYRYSFSGHRDEHEISQNDLDLHRKMIMGTIEKSLADK
ncbi:hypothetical protein [Cohnella herbarum]|uniref:Uncharacterized protein n=1 Tax=Cohnella herbarum TaxID=2728023 RepID=A0A7Z2ZLX7_9BACL|nr:hypothetical protein [Cohnella herbarum]QJD83542.1 hypothetical protein HH215_10360 [Cohnella herbarum]